MPGCEPSETYGQGGKPIHQPEERQGPVCWPFFVGAKKSLQRTVKNPRQREALPLARPPWVVVGVGGRLRMGLKWGCARWLGACP